MEWDQREILETEKQGLERENRRLKVQVKEMDELLKKKDRLSANSQGPDFKISQIELQEKNKVRCSCETGVLTHGVCLWGLGGSRLNFYTRPIKIFPFVHLKMACSFSYCDLKQCWSCLWNSVTNFLWECQNMTNLRVSGFSVRNKKSESRDGSSQIWFPVTASCQRFLNNWSYFQ